MVNSDVIAVVESLEDSTAQLHLAVGSKFTLEEASALFETKQSMIEWRDGLKKMHALVAAKPSKLDLEAVINQVHALAREFRGEIVQARYIWKIGRPSPDHTIHWNHQTVNTNASVFAWRQDADVVTLVVPGLYHVQAAFFSNLSPQLQVLINGEPVLIADEDDDSKLQHDSVGVVRRVPHSGGNLAGISLSAFLAVPARASLTLTYDLDEEAQGFLNVRKL
ncbi:TPA: LOW QUALITY PROTEIN: hypothetical protein N0F65_000031 [Lagenidium giganteum]|uniref:Uncharacterized protein n=1 Tax=Lagenidium giganteum TaxID=4803 RepID=A0AAV2YRH1_9STRA|nr:TPA: LOW QUALITY PROTEIN: hypothetical protein N0F65_000031 [Lagenidium giganteum]